MPSESSVLRGCLLAASKLGWRLFRNQVGTYKLADGRWLSSGLCKGSSDLIGWQTITITPDMVGQRVAVFTAVECKAEKGCTTPEQDNFLRQVNAAGGVAIVTKNPSDLSPK